jgi:DNA-binding NarL/FixJ family response regulator
MSCVVAATDPVPITILLADDHTLFRRGVAAVLEGHPRIRVVGDVGAADQILPALGRLRPDIILLDLMMDRGTLLDIPTIAAFTKVIVVTANEVMEEMLAAVRGGASGVVFKRFATEVLVTAIDAVAAGDMWLPPSLQTVLVRSRPDPLTVREREVVGLVGLGLKNPEIAKRLHVSDDTVKKHLNHIFAKLEVRDRVELALYAVRHGLVPPSPRR